MKKILYIGVHEVLERDELSLFTELGYDVFSYQGAYMLPNSSDLSSLLKRPGIPGMEYHADLAEESLLHPKTNIPQEFFDKFDMIIVMHDPNILVENWDRMKHKPVIWRSIGQSTTHVENMIRKMRYEGMKIIRYSPMEENIPGYVGQDAMIRFFKDPEEWKDWNGQTKRVINTTQSLKGRSAFCHYNDIMQIMNGFPALVYGTGNEDLGGLNGGNLPYELLKGALRDSRVFVYGGTWPACYTLSFMEAMMTGIPMVCIGQKLAEEMPEIAYNDRYHFYEVPEIIRDGQNGFISDNINDLRDRVHQLLEDEDLAKRISNEGRKTAIKFFGKDDIKEQWRRFLEVI